MTIYTYSQGGSDEKKTDDYVPTLDEIKAEERRRAADPPKRNALGGICLRCAGETDGINAPNDVMCVTCIQEVKEQQNSDSTTNGSGKRKKTSLKHKKKSIKKKHKKKSIKKKNTRKR